MTLKIAKSDLIQLAPAAEKHWAGIVSTCARFGISNAERQAAFLAQCAHESGGFQRVEENLNYSAEALRRVFRKYFTDEEAEAFARQPKRIASRVYADRIGNGPESSGDGWAFRGRGLIQLTGRANYRSFSEAIFGDDRIENRPDLVARDPHAAESAGWYWSEHGLNSYADRGSESGFKTITRRINGGFHGLADRRRWWLKFRDAMMLDAPKAEPAPADTGPSSL